MEDGSGDLDVLNLASGLTHLYGYLFIPHKISDRSDVHHILVDTKNEEESDSLVPVFEEIYSHRKEIQEKRGLYVEFKTRRTDGKKSNDMPCPVPVEEWEW